MTKKYIFTVSTDKVRSESSEEMEFDFDDDATPLEIEQELSEAYQEWLDNGAINCGWEEVE